MYDLFEDTGLGPASKPIRKARSFSGKFGDPLPFDDVSKPALSKSAGFKKGDTVRLKFAPGVPGTIVGVGREIAAVEWEGASTGLYRFENLILDN